MGCHLLWGWGARRLGFLASSSRGILGLLEPVKPGLPDSPRYLLTLSLYLFSLSVVPVPVLSPRCIVGPLSSCRCAEHEVVVVVVKGDNGLSAAHIVSSSLGHH